MLHIELHGSDMIHNYSAMLRAVKLYRELSKDTDVEVSVVIKEPRDSVVVPIR